MFRKAITFTKQAVRFYSSENKAKIISALTAEETTETFVNTKELEKVLEDQPQLAQYPHHLWQQLQKSLIFDQGFPREAFAKLVSQQPKLLTLPPSTLHKHIEAWRSCQFGEQRTQDLLIKYSELIMYGDSDHLRHRVSFLQQYVTTTKNVWRIFMSSPNSAFLPESQLKPKFEYLLDVMRVPVAEIVDSDVLLHSLEHIKMRHIFMDRLGLYKLRKKDADENEKNPNARLNRMMDSSDKRFATKVCHVTLFEYEVFQDLIKREWAREEVEEDDDDYDDILAHEEADERV